MTQLCGDPTCESRSCSSEALDEYLAQQRADARAFVRSMLGLPLDGRPQPVEGENGSPDGGGTVAQEGDSVRNRTQPVEGEKP